MVAVKSPIVSVILPIFNAEKYLSVCIESVLNQTFQDFELILINDGSTDGSSVIIKKYEQLDKRVKVFNNDHNLGIIDTLNVGLRLAKGKYIARMDSDDICVEDRLKYQVDYLDEHEYIFLIGGSFYLIDENGLVLRT